MFKRPRCHAWLLASVVFLVAGCGEVLDTVPPRPAALEDPAVVGAAYPTLAAVPARPRLTYSLEQRREIAEGLVADRSNARHAGDTLRQAVDRPVVPDTVPPLPPFDAPPDEPDRRPGDLSLAYLEEALARDSDDGSLGDFLERLEQPPPAVADAGASREGSPGAAALPLPGPVTAAPPVDPGLPEPSPPASRDAEPSPPALPLALVFDADDAAVREVDQAVLQRLARALVGADTVLVVSGGGARPALAMERARKVAAALVEAGFRPARLALEMGGESDVVVVYEAEA